MVWVIGPPLALHLAWTISLSSERGDFITSVQTAGTLLSRSSSPVLCIQPRPQLIPQEMERQIPKLTGFLMNHDSNQCLVLLPPQGRSPLSKSQLSNQSLATRHACPNSINLWLLPSHMGSPGLSISLPPAKSPQYIHLAETHLQPVIAHPYFLRKGNFSLWTTTPHSLLTPVWPIWVHIVAPPAAARFPWHYAFCLPNPTLQVFGTVYICSISWSQNCNILQFLT